MGQAPQQFEVASVSGVSEEPWGDNKDMTTTKVFFQGEDREWKVFHNLAWPVQIERGAVLEGWKNFDKGTFGLSNKHKGDAAPKPGSGSRSSPRSDGPGLQWKSAPYERGAEHPRNEARAIHTSALSAAPAYYELLRTEGVIDKAADKASALNTLAGIVTWLEAGYGPALDSVSAPPLVAVQTAGNGAGGQQLSEAPADMAELTPAVPASTVADESLPF